MSRRGRGRAGRRGRWRSPAARRASPEWTCRHRARPRRRPPGPGSAPTLRVIGRLRPARRLVPRSRGCQGAVDAPAAPCPVRWPPRRDVPAGCPGDRPAGQEPPGRDRRPGCAGAAPGSAGWGRRRVRLPVSGAAARTPAAPRPGAGTGRGRPSGVRRRARRRGVRAAGRSAPPGPHGDAPGRVRCPDTVCAWPRASRSAVPRRTPGPGWRCRPGRRRASRPARAAVRQPSRTGPSAARRGAVRGRTPAGPADRGPDGSGSRHAAC